MIISSLANPQVKHVRRLQADRRYRTREKAFVAEGTRWLEELLQFSVSPLAVFYTDVWQASPERAALLTTLGDRAWRVAEPVMKAMSDTQTPQGVLCVVPMLALLWPAAPSLLLILDEVTNPGNLGTMLRTAGAAGVDGVLLSPGCVDPFNPKVIRGGMGAHLRLPIYQFEWPEVSQKADNTALWLAAADGEVAYTDVDWRRPSGLIIGNEGAGVGDEARRAATGRIRIPMESDTESLNAAVAAAIILFEAARQRRA